MFLLKNSIGDNVQIVLTRFATGALIYVVVEELIPEMPHVSHSNIDTLFFSIGFSVIKILVVILG